MKKMKDPFEKHMADLVNKATYETYMQKNPELVGAIAQLLRLGETPARIEKHLNAKFPARPVAIEIIHMIAEHQNKLTKEN